MKNLNSHSNNTITLKKKTNIVSLLGINNKNPPPDFNNIKLKADEINEFDSENEERGSKLSDSTNSLDCELVGESCKL